MERVTPTAGQTAFGIGLAHKASPTATASDSTHQFLRPLSAGPYETRGSNYRGLALARGPRFSAFFKEDNSDPIPYASARISRRLVAQRHHSYVAMQKVEMGLQILANQLRPFSGYDKSPVRRSRSAVSLNDHDRDSAATPTNGAMAWSMSPRPVSVSSSLPRVAGGEQVGASSHARDLHDCPCSHALM